MKKTIFSLSLVLLTLGFFLNIGMYLKLEGQIARIHELQHDRGQRNDRMAKIVEDMIWGDASELIIRVQESPSYADAPDERDHRIESITNYANWKMETLSVDYEEPPYFGEKL